MKLLYTSVVEASAFGSSELEKYAKGRTSLPEGMTPSVRIPGMVCLPDGTLLAYAECRQGDDWSAIDIGLRRSTDGGKTWSARTVIAPGKGRNTMNNPVMIVEGDKVHFLYCENYKRLFHCVSTDKGLHFSRPKELTEIVDRDWGDYLWSVLAVGPGHGIVTHTGRLIAPMWLASNQLNMFAHHPSVIATVQSDDGGETWHMSERIFCRLPEPSECAIARLRDGRLLLNIRNESALRCRAVSFSEDNGETWTEPSPEEALPDPVCMGGMTRAGENLLFVNCSEKRARENITLRLSYDDGKTWAESLLIDHSGGYCDVVFDEQKQIAYVLYETDDCRAMKCAAVQC